MNVTITYNGPTSTADTPFADALTISDPGFNNANKCSASSPRPRPRRPGDAGHADQVPGTALPAAVPEPASLTLLGLGRPGPPSASSRIRKRTDGQGRGLEVARPHPAGAFKGLGEAVSWLRAISIAFENPAPPEDGDDL